MHQNNSPGILKMTTNNRIALALSACEGLSDAELEQRGAGAFQKMIQRKRHYAAAARMVSVAVVDMQKQLKTAVAKLQQANATTDELKALDELEGQPLDTATAASMLAMISGKKAAE